MKQNRNVSYLNQNKTKLNYVIKFSLIECSLFITITPIFRALGEQDTVSLQYQQKIVVAEVDRKRILRELQTCLYLISACWKASTRPCPEHSLPIWRHKTTS